MDKRVTCVIAEDEQLFRDALLELLRQEWPDLDVVAACDDGGAALEAIGEHKPDIAFLDIRMPGLTGLDLQQELKAVAPSLPIVFITGHADVRTSVRAMKDGAVDFLTKPVDASDLLSIVASSLARNLEALTRDSELRELRRRAAMLTPREHEVMQLVVQGKLNKQIAAELGTVEKTIKVHRARVIQKMGAESLAELVRIAEKLGIFQEMSEARDSLRVASAPRAA